MRVISGTAKGTNLYSLEGSTTRPTLDRIKETLFNIIQAYVYEAKVLDLFAGSGALAIEALSRGASYATLCDKCGKAIGIINKNVEKAHLQNKCTVIHKDYEKAIEMLNESKFDIIFIDPPYAQNIAVKAVEKIIEANLLAEDGIIIIETDDAKREEEQLKSVKIDVYDIRSYGRVKLIFLRAEK